MEWQLKQLPDGREAAYTTHQAPGAIKNGTDVIKIAKDPGDARPIGRTGVVVGSLDAGDGRIGYFVEWHEDPDVPVFVADFKIQAV